MGDTNPDLRRRIWDLLEVTEDPATGRVEWDWVDIFLSVVIVLSVVSMVLESVESLRNQYARLFLILDAFTIAVFTTEYVVRLWACTADPRYEQPFRGRLRYAASFYAVIDALAVLPFYAALVFPAVTLDLRFLRVVRLMRFARVLKIGRYSEALDRLKAVFQSKKSDLGVALVCLFVILVLASSVMYFIEQPAQPDTFSSIPASMWWGITALTTVGAKDIEPISPVGKLLGGGIQLLGIAVFAIPAGILASGYEEEARRRRAGDGVCSTCGQPLDGRAHEKRTP